jgi:hypothetical protein
MYTPTLAIYYSLNHRLRYVSYGKAEVLGRAFADVWCVLQ